MLRNSVTFTPVGHLAAPQLMLEPEGREVRFSANTSDGETVVSTMHVSLADGLQQVVNRMRIDGAREYEVTAS